MHFFRRLAFLLAVTLPAIPTVPAESPNSSSSAAQDPATSSSSASQATTGETQGQISVQQRIRQRREQRRATAIHDAYDHRWETYMDMGYLRFTPGPNEQRLTYYAWQSGLTQFRGERLGYTFEGRGYYGTAYVGLNATNKSRYAISQYDLLFGPVYRFYLQPKYSISGRVMAGPAYGNFNGDTNGIGNLSGVGTLCGVGQGPNPPTNVCLLYPNGWTYAASASVVGEYNLTPSVGFKLAPEYFFTGFGSTVQASRGFTIGVIYRFGKQ
jgi:hypothetical protein